MLPAFIIVRLFLKDGDTQYEQYQPDDDKNEKQCLGNGSRAGSNTGKTKNGGDDSDHEKG